MILIPRKLLTTIENLAESAYPEESCGLLIGHGEAPDNLIITQIEVSENVFEGDKTKFFEVDPQLQFNLMRELRGSDIRIVGNFHSHPDGPAEPSEQDNERVGDPALAWLITSITNGQIGDTNAFVFDPRDRRFSETGLQTTD